MTRDDRPRVEAADELLFENDLARANDRGGSAMSVPYFILALLCLTSVVSRLYLMLR